jgi:hypothetical protein
MKGLDFEIIVYTPYLSVDGFIYDLLVRSLLFSIFTFSLVIHGVLRFIIAKHKANQCDLRHEFLILKYEFHLLS